MIAYIASVKKKDFRKAALALNKDRDNLYERKTFLEEQWAESIKRTGYNECGEKCRFYRKKRCLSFGRKCILLVNAAVSDSQKPEMLEYERNNQLFFNMEIAIPIDEFRNRQLIERELKIVKENIDEVEKKLSMVMGSASLKE